jgi:SAM-dependent methyltransferase
MDSIHKTGSGEDEQARANAAVWARGEFVDHYASRELRPAEVMFLVRYRDELRGSVLELGCGAGRLTGYLIEMASEVYGIDISPRMIDHCKRVYPGGNFHTLDLREIASLGTERFDAVIGTYNVLGVLGEEERRQALSTIAAVLRPGGLLMISAHNLAFVPKLRDPTDLRGRNLLRSAGRLVLLPGRMRNRRALAAQQRTGDGYAIVNDDAHNYRLLHYYISRDAQERQLRELGFEFVECLDHNGHTVPAGQDAADWVELYYVARLPS